MALTRPRGVGDQRAADAASLPTDYPAYRPDIDGLRALAVLAVIAFHAFPGAIPGGFVGVDIFFVISGYLIGGIILRGLDRGSFSFVDFYARRIRRIFPALLIVLAAVLVAGRALLLPDEYELLGKHVVASALFAANFAFNAEAGYFDVSADLKPLLHLWSLGIEEQFYIFLPTALFLVWSSRIPVLPFLLAVAGASFILNVVEIRIDQVATFFLPTTRIWELLIGCVLAYAELHSGALAPSAIPRIPARYRCAGRSVCSILGIATIALSVTLLNDGLPFPGWLALFPTLGTALVIAAGPEALVNRTILSVSAIVGIGLISYPLYLWHWPLLSFATIVESGVPGIAARIALIALSFVLAFTTYRLVERPIRRHGTIRAVWGLTGGAATVAVAGLVVFSSQGMLSRHADYQIAFDALRDERDTAIRSPRCHFDSGRQSFAAYRKTIDECLRIDPDKPNILVLGDSHAADIWLALARAYEGVNFLQATGAACTPVEASRRRDRRHAACAELLRYIKQDFAGLAEVDGVVLAARWHNDFRAVADEVTFFKERGIPVALFGPTFEYSADVPRIVYRHATDAEEEKVAAYFVPERADLDEEMTRFAQAHRIPYVSRIEALCTATHCPVVGEEGVLVIDKEHWSVAGAQHFGDELERQRILEQSLGESAVSLGRPDGQ